MLKFAANGASDYIVLVDEATASPSEIYAASEFVSFAGQVTGAIMPLMTTCTQRPRYGAYQNPKYVVIGKNGFTAELGLDSEIDAVGDEGFILRSVDDTIVIAGGRQRGTLYGVYTFLEDYLGCRWYTPQVSSIPRRSHVELPELNVTKTPAFRIREAFNMENFDGDWAARNKANASNHRLMAHHGGAIRYLGVHSFNRLVPPEEYFDEHPEYFSEVNGVRVKERSQLCLTNPEVFEIALKNLRKSILEHPECSIFSVSQNDWGNYCTCEKCRAVDEEEDSHMGTVLRFVNKIDDAIRKEFPHISIDTLAYQYTRRLPKITKPNPGVLIRLCTIECCFAHPLDECHVDKTDMPSNFSQDIAAWSQVSRDLFIWDYTTDFANYLMPFANLHVLKRNLKFFKDHGAIGVFEEGCPNTFLSYAGELRNYVLAKLMYDMDLDENLLIDEFLCGVYGPAAAPVKAFYQLWQDACAASGEHLFEDDPPTRSYFTRENLDKARALINQAIIMAPDEATRLRVEKIGLSCDFMDMVQMDKGPAKDAAVDELLDKCKAMGMHRITEWHTFEQSEQIFKGQDAQLPKPVA